MPNVNGSRFDLLLGRADWGRCLDGDGAGARTAAELWDGVAADAALLVPTDLPDWDAQASELRLRPVRIDLPRTPGESPLALDARRAAAADRHGNVYRIGGDGASLVVFSAGDSREGAFWPDDSGCAAPDARAQGEFAPSQAARAGAERYLALAVTADDYLVVVYARGSERGLLSFDLVAGGPPLRLRWPGAGALEAIDMAARDGGGVWVLDRGDDAGGPLLWELDCRLALVSGAAASPPEPPEQDDFQPVAGAPRERPAVAAPAGLALRASPAWTADPIAVESAGPGTVLLLDRDVAAGRWRVVRLRRDGAAWSGDPSAWLDASRTGGLAHDFVFATARVYGEAGPSRRLFVATASGNQAFAYAPSDEAEDFELRGAAELFPLRRFGGRALVAVRGAATYDSGIAAPAWTPVVHQPRARYEERGVLVTPVFDSREFATTWDRLLLDGCIPPGTEVRVESRAGDECEDAAGVVRSPGAAQQVLGLWEPEPGLHLRGTGPELPWLRAEAAPATRREAGAGTWEVLLQRAHGRYLQLRLTLASGSGTATPRLRALRVWSPRFSYPRRFLPAVYREDAASASLLERYLANCESTLTMIEDRVVNVEDLFDPRVAPAEALAWLGDWLDVAADPSWGVRRQRLLVRYAMELFRWRGTPHGLRMALELAFGDRADPHTFDAPGGADARPQCIRIVESYQTRLLGGLALGDPEAADGPRTGRRETLWTPAEGNGGLVSRWAAARGTAPTPAEELAPFALVAPAGAEGGRWRTFAQSALGFVPSAGADERARWQRHLAAKYPTVEALRAAHGVSYASVAAVPLPRDWPTQAAPAADWEAFSEGGGALTRRRWQDFLARRHRRLERLNREHGTSWPSFDVVALPDVLPATQRAQGDWLRFERDLLAMHRTAHRFSVLLPVADVAADAGELETRLGLARRIVELEKPAHTVFDVRFFWAFFRIGEARLSLDTLLGAGSRAPELIPTAVLGRTYIGSAFVGGAPRLAGGDRLTIPC
ncbi:MAG: phage tail protein [Gemmatimonadaceae bacterium]